jgi:hypothetical protein
LLVVISILGILVALLLPAVQDARESARRTQCKSHLRQIGLACLAHEQAHRHLPSGGWGWRWAGDPDRGFNHRQPGGWIFNVLPYLEQSALRSKGKGQPSAQKQAAGREVVQTPLVVFNCPARRAAIAYPFVHPDNFYNIDRPDVAGRSDYAANVGDKLPMLYGPGPATLAQGDSPSYAWTQLDRTGVVFRRSEIRPAHIRDGLSSTYLAAESYLNPLDYETGVASNNNQGMYAGYDRDTLRATHIMHRPLRDRPGLNADHAFGSAHPSGFQAALCDGSVRLVSYRIAPETHRRLGNRHDGRPVDAAGL